MSHSVPWARNSKPYYGLFPKQAPKPYYGLFWGGGHHLWQLIGSDSEGKLFLWGYPKTAPPPQKEILSSSHKRAQRAENFDNHSLKVEFSC